MTKLGQKMKELEKNIEMNLKKGPLMDLVLGRECRTVS
jgi:hypothetical protein